ncbi:MAG: glycosyltransferase family 4 protein [Rhodospirillales bacterium]
MSNGDHPNTLTPATELPPAPPCVLQVLPRMEAGGVERGTVEIARAIVEHGGIALVASAGGAMVRELERAGAEHFTMPLASKNPLTMFRNIRRLADLAQTRNARIIHARSRAPAWSAFYAAKRLGRAFVTTYHGAYNDNGPVKRWYNSIMARGDRVIAISEFIANRIERKHGIGRDMMRVIHRGVDLSRFDPATVSAERIIQLSNEWRLPDGAPVIMLPGRLSRWKGQLLLIRALAELGRPDVRCLIVGKGATASYRREMEKLVEKHDLGQVVHIVDHCNDMPAAYMLTDVVVSASTDPEAFGRVVAEAQAMGRPVVAPAHGAAPEIIGGRDTGRLFKPRDPSSLAEAISAIIAMDAAQREDLSLRAIGNIRDNFSLEQMCTRTLDVYNEVYYLDMDR